ncbi:MAG TPA: alpha/beta hydrolase [Gemmatimonadaceae bacterium]
MPGCIVEGVAPPSLRNPLPHARAAQDALDSILAACARRDACHRAYPDGRADLDSILARLRHAPAKVGIPNAAAGTDTTQLRWQQFAEALRVMTYRVPTLVAVPKLLHQAARGDMTAFALAAITSNRGLRSLLRFGFLLSITCSEDVPRIREAEIHSATRDTYLGDSRVREQIGACAQWPHAPVPSDYGAPIRSSVPVFLLSGAWDPVAPPSYGADAARYLTNSIHVIAPGAHVPTGPCVVAMERAFLAAASPNGVNTGCVATMTLPPFIVDSISS